MRCQTTAATTVLTVLLLSACSSADGAAGSQGESSDDDPIVVAHVPLPLFAPLYLADAEGYFADEGIEVQLETVAAGQDAVPLAASGEVDAIVAGFSAGFFSSLDAGLELQVVGSMTVAEGATDYGAADLVASTALVESGEVGGVADLEGRRIAVAGGPGGAGAYLVDILLREEGLSVADVELTNIANADMAAALSSGAVDAAQAAAPFNATIQADGTGRSIGVPPEGASATGVIFSQDFAETDRAQRFFNALVRAASELQGEGRADPRADAAVAAAMKVDVSVIESLPRFAWRPDLAPLPDQLEAMQRTWIDAGQLTFDEPIPAEEFSDETFSQRAVEAQE